MGYRKWEGEKGAPERHLKLTPFTEQKIEAWSHPLSQDTKKTKAGKGETLGSGLTRTVLTHPQSANALHPSASSAQRNKLKP